ncbi:hypothetical protein MWN34_14490 [Ancylobacter sp. 6x-1]|uniref:Uncharacterized protein n=1 Tax=Ancylobacter crimeensis TaxID=2579147 RepID=A0ABT0DDR7_9HYPH|nr:hypothetical protein [Ancylobacter crimeensis]MCK0198119.1 hypothetical protein [Ancylobacter crimeensis]
MSRPPFRTTTDLPTRIFDPGAASSSPNAPPSPDLSQKLCASDRPLALLPVRLETRFFTLADGSRELRVRIYPDKIHLDSYEPKLLAAEREWGIHYWEADWRAGNDLPTRKAAWRQLAQQYGPARAAFIVRALRPTNPGDRPSAPMAPDHPFEAPPAFPDVMTEPSEQTSAWRSAPAARLLPARWIVVLQAGGIPVLAAQGSPIPSPLAVGPDPKGAVPADGQQAPVDEGMRWMVDFETAEAKGMGVRVALPATIGADGFDSLMVFGTAEADAAASSVMLADLLDAHHYTDGLEFLRLGAVTNNTADGRTAYAASDPGQERSFMREIAPDPSMLGKDTNARQLGLALGLPAGRVAPTLGYLGQADECHEADNRNLGAALWPTTWGYFLDNMIGFEGTGLTPDTVDWVRRYFIDHVRAFGPLAPLRAGRQPYGLLPVTSLDLLQAKADETAAFARNLQLRDLLVKLRDRVWRPQLGQVPRLGARTSPPDPDADLADMMQMDGVSAGVRTRALLGRHYLQHLRAFLGEDLQAAGFIQAQDEITGALPGRLGLPDQARLGHVAYAELTWPVNAPLVQDGPIAADVPLTPNYITALLAAPTLDAVIGQRPDPAATTPQGTLLQTVLRHGLLRETAQAAARLAASAPGADLGALLRDAELIDLVTGAEPTPSFRRQLGMIPSATAPQTIGAFLEAQTSFDNEALASLGEYRGALAQLQTLDVERLQLLLLGGLDLAANRLDAWITSFATQRLRAMRAAAPEGIYVGAYGWIENVHPAPALQPVPQPPPGMTDPVFMAPDDSGFIHAPSLTHASAAALLRNAHLGADGSPGPDSPFAIRLSSRRVRDAEQLLAGMRQGQPLGALLGYRVERGLHELGLDACIAPLRELAPLTAGRLTPADKPLEAIAANNVVDGLALQALWRDQNASVRAKLQAAGADIDKAARELDQLADMIDGLSDGLVAEAAYQMARGNPTRLASSLAAIAQGDGAPPELEVAHMPRSGTALTHRVLVLMSGSVQPAAGWPSAASSARASADPMLNAWTSRLLGDPRNIRCSITVTDATGASTIRTLPFSDLGLSPLDVVCSVATDPAARSTGPSELEQRVLYAARRMIGAGGTLGLNHDRPADLATGERTLFDILEQACTAQRLLSGARAAEPEDIAPPQHAPATGADLVDLERRIVAAEAALAAIGSEPQDGLSSDALRELILKCAGFGIGPAVPASASGDDSSTRAALAAQARALAKAVQARLDRGADLRKMPAASDDRARARQLRERLTAVFGSGFPGLASFTCDAAGAAELAAALADAPALLRGVPAAAEGWLLRASRVREPLSRLGACLRGAEALDTGERLNLHVAQLPFSVGRRWVGLPMLPGEPLAFGALSLVLQTTDGILDATAPLCGLWIDEWTEVVPSIEETTALTFQFNPPDAMAPQAILLAVPPQPDQDWTVGTLYRVLAETLDLAKLRVVDPNTLGDAAHYLPAAYLAFNVADDVASSDLGPLTR